MSNIKVKSTKDYDRFKKLKGNRQIDKRHVKRLIKKMSEEGNLTQHFPIVVTGDYKVVEGQHRLEALKELDWEVYYYQQPNLTINTVQTMNSTSKNWNWRDYAESYATLGNKNYEKFMGLVELYGYSFSIILHYSMGLGSGEATGDSRNKSGDFFKGKFKMRDMKTVIERLTMLREVDEVTEGRMTRDLAIAFYKAFIAPNYDHKRMLQAVKNHQTQYLLRYNGVREYMRAIEDMYNHGLTPERRIRIF